MDRLDSITRSALMSRVKSRGAKSTERRLRALLVQSGTRGWLLGHRFGLPGRPDFVFPKARVAVFVDGCFWHGCRRCRTIPKSNHPFWAAKIGVNQARDRRVTRALRACGWNVVRIWEHELREDSPRTLERIQRAMSGGRVGINYRRKGNSS